MTRPFDPNRRPGRDPKEGPKSAHNGFGACHSGLRGLVMEFWGLGFSGQLGAFDGIFGLWVEFVNFS